METYPSKSQSTELPAVASVVTHEVSDYAAWKRIYDRHADARKRAGIFTAHVNRDAENPNLITIYLGARNSDSLQSFLSSSDLKSTMQKAGVKAPPQIFLIKPIEDLTIKDRALPAVMVRHRVADYAAWKKVFDDHAGTRGKAGIVGHAVNRGIDEPNLVVVYLQAEKFDQLHSFTNSADLKQTMERAGVQGSPQISFVNGQRWGN